MDTANRFSAIQREIKLAYRNLKELRRTLGERPFIEKHRLACHGLADTLILQNQEIMNVLELGPGVILGQQGGLKTAQRGSDYFKHISGMRKTRAGGRPRKETQQSQHENGNP